MIKLVWPRKYILPLLLCMSSSVFAEHKGFYGIFRKSVGPEEKAVILAKNSLAHLIDTTSTENLSEFDIFHAQLSHIIDKGKEKHSDVRQAAWKLLSPSHPPYGFWEAGLGYYFQLVMPFSIEGKLMAEHKHELWHAFFSTNFKAFLPLGSKTKLYLTVGKTFQLNPNQASASIWHTDDAVLQDIKKTVLEKTPSKHWEDSMTSFGGGIVKRMSSKIEVDVSVQGYTTRDLESFYGTASLGVHYCF